jgi:hypothetical protein
VANAVYLELIGGRDVVGKPREQTLPKVKEQGLVDLLDRVQVTSEPASVQLQRDAAKSLRQTEARASGIPTLALASGKLGRSLLLS